MPYDSLPTPLASAVAEAVGHHRRQDAVLPSTGGPAGNAVLTAWTGLVVLVLAVGELLTLVDVRGLISWHVALGALLIPPALLKTATTGWRMARYYLGAVPYQEAGPPPLLLRLLGPLVVLSTVALLGTGVLLVLKGDQASRMQLFTVVGHRVDWVTLHQGAFILWAVATGLHLLGRIVPALRIATQQGVGRVPGRAVRVTTMVVVLAAAAALAVLLVHADGSWAQEHFFHRFPPGGTAGR